MTCSACLNASHHETCTSARSGQTHFRFVKRIVLGLLVLGFSSLLLGVLWLGVQAGSSNSAMPTQGYQQPMNDGGERTQDFHSEEGEVEGEILRRPSDSQGAGGWLMRSDRGIWYWIYADQDTEFKPGLPDIGDRVKAKYSWEFYGGALLGSRESDRG
ncbi:MAG: hypothetical protein R2867_17615 [Caldilineaceae bacterium]